MPGGRKSLEILANLERGRLASLAAARASRRVGDLDWRPVVPLPVGV